MDSNPYEPQFSPGTLSPESVDESEEIRRKYLNHEASVKSIGVLYFLGGFFGLILTPIYCLGGINAFMNAPPDNPAMLGSAIALLFFGLIFAVLTILQLWSGWGVRRLQPSARIGAGIVAAIGLIGFPIGTLISAYFLYLLFSEKGKFVFSDTYKQVVEQTPHIRYKTSIIVWIFLAILLLLLGIGIVAAVVGTSR